MAGFPTSAGFAGLAAAGAMTALAGVALAAEAPKDAASCRRTGEALYKRAEALHKKTHLIIPRELVRVSADLDDFCQAKDFKQALVSVEWMETCLNNWRKPYKLGYCSRSKKYFCAVYPDSEGCKGG